MMAIIAWIMMEIERFLHWMHMRKVNRRIKRQAKAMGVWDKPQSLGGRMLELYAWGHFQIERKDGETDAQLRRRCIRMADKHLTSSPWGRGD